MSEVHPRISGTFVQRPFNQGSEVEAGDVL